jgi:hypothetical protein
MLIVPGLHPLPQTPHSRELARRLEETVRDYHRDHPELTEDEIRAALTQSAPSGDSRFTARRRRAFGVGLSAAMVGAFTALASNGGRLPFGRETWTIVAVVATVCVVAIGVVVLARRD